MLTILAFVFVLGVLIFIHELGHFLVAKKVGIKVETFSLGFPPHIVKFNKGGTDYAIGIIPLGGYVKMAGEHPDEEYKGSPDEFMSKSVGARAAVIFAGPFMNYVLAILLLFGLFFLRGTPVVDPDRIVVGQVRDDGPAATAGLMENDQIIAVDGQEVNNFEDMRKLINAHVAEPVDIVWLRNGDTMQASMVTDTSLAPNLEGGVDTVGIIGIGQQIAEWESYGFFESAWLGFTRANMIVVLTADFVKKTISGEVSAKLIGGPLFIAQQSGREAEKGPSALFSFMALLSVNLAVLNILPIPVLDGGQLVFLAVEKLKGSPLSMRARLIAQQVGIVLILGLVVVVTYNDIMRFLQGI